MIGWVVQAVRHMVTGLMAGVTLLGSPYGNVWAQTADNSPTGLPTSVMAADDQRPELKELIPQYRLIGKGRLTFWGLQIYDARLWASPGFSTDSLAAQPFALELAYLRSFDKKAIAERSIKEMRRAAPVNEDQANAWTAELLRVLPSTKAGDRVTGVNRPGAGVLFLLNGKPTGEIRDLEFARQFFGIWLSPQTSEPKLRSALLAGTP